MTTKTFRTKDELLIHIYYSLLDGRDVELKDAVDIIKKHSFRLSTSTCKGYLVNQKNRKLISFKKKDDNIVIFLGEKGILKVRRILQFQLCEIAILLEAKHGSKERSINRAYALLKKLCPDVSKEFADRFIQKELKLLKKSGAIDYEGDRIWTIRKHPEVKE